VPEKPAGVEAAGQATADAPRWKPASLELNSRAVIAADDGASRRRGAVQEKRQKDQADDQCRAEENPRKAAKTMSSPAVMANRFPGGIFHAEVFSPWRPVLSMGKR
jgi:hypothetical protein